jgi:hypothetical protein
MAENLLRRSHRDIRRGVAVIENEDLVKEFRGNKRPKVNNYKFYFRDFIKDIGNNFMEKEFFPTKKKEKETTKKTKLF